MSCQDLVNGKKISKLEQATWAQGESKFPNRGRNGKLNLISILSKKVASKLLIKGQHKFSLSLSLLPKSNSTSFCLASAFFDECGFVYINRQICGDLWLAVLETSLKVRVKSISLNGLYSLLHIVSYPPLLLLIPLLLLLLPLQQWLIQFLLILLTPRYTLFLTFFLFHFWSVSESGFLPLFCLFCLMLGIAFFFFRVSESGFYYLCIVFILLFQKVYIFDREDRALYLFHSYPILSSFILLSIN